MTDDAANIPELRGHGMTFNITYSHVLCHAEVKRRTRQMRLFATFYLYAMAVSMIVLWVR